MDSTVKVVKPFMNGRSQAIRIPYEFRFDLNEDLVINKVGSTLMITPRSALKNTFDEGIAMLSDDFMADGRPEETSNEERMKGIKF